MLELKEVSVSYGDLRVLSEVSFTVREGETVALIGPNGAGKTTTLRAIMGLVSLQAGEICYLGRTISRTPPYRLAEMGISLVPEGRKIFPQMSVRENLELGGFVLKWKTDLKSRLEWVYQLFPVLEERQEQFGGTLSGGEQQMLAIGRALMSNPRMLMLDEPSLGLAPIVIEHLYERIEELKRGGVTLLIVEQYVSGALELADRACVLESGTIRREGRGQDLLTDPEIQKAYLAL